jgi:hypothetical protein
MGVDFKSSFALAKISLDNNVPSFLNKMGCAFIDCENRKEQVINMNNFFIKNVKDVYS